MKHFPEGKSKRVKQTKERISVLYYGDKRMTVQEYYGKILALMLTILFWGGGILLFSQIMFSYQEQEAILHSLERPEYGQGERNTDLEVMVGEESEKVTFSVKIDERQYTKEEIQIIFKEIMQEIDVHILGENESLEEVRTDLILPTSMQDGIISMEWVISPSDLLDNSGVILREPVAAGEVVELRALLRYGEEEAEYTCYAHLYPQLKTTAEEQRHALEKEVEKANQASIHEEKLTLPDKVGDKTVQWIKANPNTMGILIFMLVVFCISIFLQKEQALEKGVEERKRQLIMDYPELLFKINMLLGAGLTIQAAFIKVSTEYRKRESSIRYVYEEITVTCLEINNGVGEATAYMNFGKRCQESRYIKLGSLLSQNLKKGNKDLREILEREAVAGMEERKNIARKLGEEAGTKLLMPMVLMLLVVLVILLIPAVMAF